MSGGVRRGLDVLKAEEAKPGGLPRYSCVTHSSGLTEGRREGKGRRGGGEDVIKGREEIRIKGREETGIKGRGRKREVKGRRRRM